MDDRNQHSEKMAAPEGTAPKQKFERVSISILGAEDVGKRCLVRRYCFGMFNDEYDPMDDGDGYRKQCVISETICLLSIDIPNPFWLEHGNEAHRIARHADALMFAYDGTDPESIGLLQPAKEKLQPHILGATWPPLAVVATKADRAAELGEAWEEGLGTGREVAREVGASFFTTSAVSGDGVDEAVEELVAAVLRSRGALAREGASQSGTKTETGEPKKWSKLCCFA